MTAVLGQGAGREIRKRTKIPAAESATKLPAAESTTKLIQSAPEPIQPASESVDPVFYNAVSALERFVSEHVLSPRNETWLTSRVDALLDEPEYYRLHDRVRMSVTADMLQEATTARRTTTPGVLEVAAGPRNARKIERVSRLVQCEVAAALQLMAHEAEATLREGHQLDRAVPPLAPLPPDVTPGAAYLTHPQIPSAMKRGMLASHRAQASMVALGASLSLEDPLSENMVDAIVDLLERSLYIHVRTLAGFPDVKVPEDVVPLSERVDLAAAFRDRFSAEQVYAVQLEAARASGGDVYPADPLDD